MGTMTLGSMLILGEGLSASTAAQVGRHACAFVQNLDRGGRGANLHQLVHQVVGHAVEIGIEGCVANALSTGLVG